ncbi:MAG TPA: phosphoglycerate mutase family protein [Allosphingosinicella sp.]|nr:phosphoglycerate mutase family protein [Allosphingosinicella sp.]
MRVGGMFAALAGTALMLAGCATTPEGAAEAAAQTPAYYVMRHLEKAEGADPALSAAGAANAQRLAVWFDGRTKPQAIYVSTTRRARETAAPLAARLGLTPREYNPADTAGLVAQVRGEPGSVLVVGHSNTVPEIVAGLGGTRPAPLADTDYGTIWVVTKDRRTELLAL